MMLGLSHRRKVSTSARRWLPATVALAALIAADADAQAGASRTAAPKPAPARPASNYWVYVGAESADLMHRVRFGPTCPAGTPAAKAAIGCAVVEKTIGVGSMPTEMEGPHGLAISPDARYLHLSTGHGTPDGMYWKYALGPDTLVGAPIPLGNFPASLDVTPDGLYAFVVNFNLHGEMVPSSVSVVYTPTNTEVARTTTCTMPHGSRVDRTGARQYSTCMMDDQLVEVDTRTFAVSRRFSLAKGAEKPIAVTADSEDRAAHMADPTHAGMAPGAPMKMPPATCSPTWAQPSATSGHVYVACNKSDEIIELDRDGWKISRRFKTGRGPYNLAVSPDGKLLVATLKPGSSVQVFDLATGASRMTEKTSTTLAHGVTISSDSRYAFTSSEGVGAAPGKVDVFDLRAFTKVASVDVGQQASGIAFWKMEPATKKQGSLPSSPPGRNLTGSKEQLLK